MTVTGVAFCDVTPYSLVDRYERSRRTCCIKTCVKRHGTTSQTMLQSLKWEIRCCQHTSTCKPYQHACFYHILEDGSSRYLWHSGTCLQVSAYQITRYHTPEHSHLRVSMRITGMCLRLAVLEKRRFVETSPYKHIALSSAFHSFIQRKDGLAFIYL